MKNNPYPFYFILVSMVCLLLGLLCGLLVGFQYIIPEFLKSILPFSALRPLHTLFVVSWIILSATGGIYYYLNFNFPETKINSKLIPLHFWVFILTGIGLIISYLFGQFGGKEYIEFPAYYYFPILLGWIVFGLAYFKTTWSAFKTWPIYYWMWGTGIVFMMYHFTEAHLWLLPYFKGHFIQNTAMQWKAGGSYVGSWNMLVYGTSLYVISKISTTCQYTTSKKAYFFYFLGLINLMFGWAHHIYIIPTAPWIRYVAYAISMTEWVILFSILYDWGKNLPKATVAKFSLAYGFMKMANFWVFLNIVLALFISIPSVNLYTHGTHITVAHSMGTTIGINTLILLSSLIYILESTNSISLAVSQKIQWSLRFFNFSFIGFWLTLVVIGIKKGYWMYEGQHISFGEFQDSLHRMYLLFVLFGIGMAVGLYRLIVELIKLVIHQLNRNNKLIKG